MPKFSIIIPVAEHETELSVLLESLLLLDDVEIIVSSQKEFGEKMKAPNIKYTLSDSGRAQAMNTGAQAATGMYLWFLHADTAIPITAFQKLILAIPKNPHALYYFDLVFDDPSLKMKLTNMGVWLRSHILGLPYGDQGFAISKKNFDFIGGYPEGAAYGEDHLFLWFARQKGIPVKCVGDKLTTSARKYKKNGWLKTTLLHQHLFVKQAIPEWIKLMKCHFKGKGKTL